YRAGSARGDCGVRGAARVGQVDDAMTAGGLRLVHRDVGPAHEALRVDRVARVARDADRDGRRERLLDGLLFEARGVDGTADALGDLVRLLGRRRRQQHAELLPAEAGGDVVPAQLTADHGGDSL